MQYPVSMIAGVILAGGRARRMGGQDKGLLPFMGQPMVEHVLRRLRPQVGRVVINANRHQDHYQRYGCWVVPDAVGDYAGPLAGMYTAMLAVTEPWLVTVPCDSPQLPSDLVQRLWAQAEYSECPLVVAHDGQRIQPVVALMRRDLLADLRQFLDEGGRKIDVWYARHPWVSVDFSTTPEAFANINTPQERADLEERLSPGVQSAAADWPVAQALEHILADCRPLPGQETIPTQAGLGRILAHAIIAQQDSPPMDNSAMDGYAFRSADAALHGPVAVWSVVGRALAGHPYTGRLGPGECVRITTGAPIPEGADAVIVQEDTRLDGERVQFVRLPGPGANIRRQGEDMRTGAAVLTEGRSLNPADLGLLAALGHAEIRVTHKPRVAIFSTGDELCPPGQPLPPGHIYDANRYSLQGLLAQLPVQVVDLGLAPDDPARLHAFLSAAAAQADVVISSGGVSVGEADHMKACLAELGAVHFWKVACKPGRPLAFGRLHQGAWFFGLPGNPVATIVTFLQFVRPALQVMAGQTLQPPLTLRLPCLDALAKRPGRTEWQRGRFTTDAQGQLAVTLSGRQGSGMLQAMSHAQCLIVLEHARGPIVSGDWVSVQPLPGWS